LVHRRVKRRAGPIDTLCVPKIEKKNLPSPVGHCLGLLRFGGRGDMFQRSAHGSIALRQRGGVGRFTVW